jgi:hypothetical protein
MMHAGRSDARMQSSATRLSRLITSAADKHKDKQDDNDVGSPPA